MIELKEDGTNIHHIHLFSPKSQGDENVFLQYIDSLLVRQRFGLLLHVSGEEVFSANAKKNLGAWFKSNKLHLRKKCFGLARVDARPQKIGRLKRKVLQLAMPCPYGVFENREKAISWLNTCLRDD